MLKFLGQRLASGLVLVVVVSAVSFWLVYLGSGDIARTIVGDGATDAQVALKAEELGLDQPIIVQFGAWLSSAVRGDFGVSWFSNQEISTLVAAKLPVTLSIAAAGTLVSAAIGSVLGAFAALRRGWLDRVLQIIAIVGFALPGFWFALVLVATVAVQVSIFPATGYIPLTSSPVGWAASLVLPVASLAIGVTAAIAQQVRSALIDVLRQDYIRSLRSRGLSEGQVVVKHALRNAAPAALTVLSLQFINLLGGAVIIERIFALPGLGQMTLDATVQGDVPAIMALLVFTVLIVVSVNLVLDVAYGWLNPKVRIA